MLTILLDLLNITFFYQSNGAFPLFSLMLMGKVQVKYCRFTLSVFSFHTFLLAAPSPSFIFLLSIFHLPRSSPSLPRGLPISPCFSPIFLLNCFVASHISSGRSSFFRQPSLFVLFDKTRTNFQLLLLFCQRHCLQIQIKACLCNTRSQDFPLQLFQKFSIQHDSLYLSPRLCNVMQFNKLRCMSFQ